MSNQIVKMSLLFVPQPDIPELFVSLLLLTQIILFLYCQFSSPKVLDIFWLRVVAFFVFFCCFSAVTYSIYFSVSSAIIFQDFLLLSVIPLSPLFPLFLLSSYSSTSPPAACRISSFLLLSSRLCSCMKSVADAEEQDILQQRYFNSACWSFFNFLGYS